MRKMWLLLAALLVVSVTNSAWAQEEQEEDPPILRLSFYKCDLNVNPEQVEEEITTEVIPVWEELVSEDRGIEDYGYFIHAWADEWNVGIYTIGESIAAIVDAAEEAGNRLEERYGDDGPSAFAQACPQHRDGFYVIGPSTGMDQDQE